MTSITSTPRVPIEPELAPEPMSGPSRGHFEALQIAVALSRGPLFAVAWSGELDHAPALRIVATHRETRASRRMLMRVHSLRGLPITDRRPTQNAHEFAVRKIDLTPTVLKRPYPLYAQSQHDNQVRLGELLCG